MQAEAYNPYSNRWLAIAASADSPYTATVFTSLLNTAVTYNPYTTLPYGGAVMTACPLPPGYPSLPP